MCYVRVICRVPHAYLLRVHECWEHIDMGNLIRELVHQANNFSTLLFYFISRLSTQHQKIIVMLLWKSHNTKLWESFDPMMLPLFLEQRICINRVAHSKNSIQLKALIWESSDTLVAHYKFRIIMILHTMVEEDGSKLKAHDTLPKKLN